MKINDYKVDNIKIPKAKRQYTKIKVLFFDKNFRSKSIATTEDKKDEIIPIIIGKISTTDEDL